jgi:hypothetical protein
MFRLSVIIFREKIFRFTSPPTSVKVTFLLDTMTLKTEALSSFEMSVNIYPSANVNRTLFSIYQSRCQHIKPGKYFAKHATIAQKLDRESQKTPSAT